jgi:aminoglycoside/choline kinase family phosphotransferase
LIHRDFQSQNIIIHNGQPYFIDFQGMRPGLAEYDLASLLYDPYVRLTKSERTQLFDIYREAAQVSAPAFFEKFQFCAMQRLMQALGAYAYLGLVKKNRAFLAHIPPALESLGEILCEIPGLDPLHELLATCDTSLA